MFERTIPNRKIPSLGAPGRMNRRSPHLLSTSFAGRFASDSFARPAARRSVDRRSDQPVEQGRHEGAVNHATQETHHDRAARLLRNFGRRALYL